jgi:predicted component of type VI protein secretion system
VAALVFLTGPAAGRRLEIDGEVLIGRQGVDLVVEDPEMSRRHARLRAVEGGVRVDDVGSRNGTWVGGSRITEPVTVAPGTTIRFGDSECRVEVASAAVPPPAPPVPVPGTGAPTPAAPAAPVGAFSPPGGARRRAATRLVGPTVLCFAAIALDAVALLLYFGLR